MNKKINISTSDSKVITQEEIDEMPINEYISVIKSQIELNSKIIDLLESASIPKDKKQELIKMLINEKNQAIILNKMIAEENIKKTRENNERQERAKNKKQKNTKLKIKPN